MTGDADAGIRRVLAALTTADALDALGTYVSGADLTSFLLEVTRRRAAALSPADVLRRARTDRFVEPGTVDARGLHRVIATVVDSIPAGFEFVEPAPVAPLGTHSVIATVHQHKVVSTVRGTEVAADPTNTLALLAALRRASGSQGTLRLGAVQRVLRAQPFGDIGQAHFTVVGLVIAGRDGGNLSFERTALIEQVGVMVEAVRSVTDSGISVRVTNLRDEYTDAIIGELAHAIPHATVTADPDREAGRGYYCDLCFKVIVRTLTGDVEVGDGGFTDWMGTLTGNRKERLLIGGLGLDRLVSLVGSVS